MSELERIIAVKGVAAVLRFNDDGSVGEYLGDLDENEVHLVAQLSYANFRISLQNSDVLTSVFGATGWSPKGWFMLGNTLSLCTVGNVACFVSNSANCYNAVVQALTDLGREETITD